MAGASKLLLVKNGFIKKDFKDLYKGKKQEEYGTIFKPEHADEEVAEEFKDQYLTTGFPFPIKRFKLIWETFNMSIEEAYFWILNYCRQDLGFPNIYKTIDVFAAAENSAFFGVSQQRIGLQQDKVSQYLATIGKMVKELFQLVRELRIIDERLVYYQNSYLDDLKKRESAEITLKGIFIDMVEGGSKNPSSVFGMAREVGFISLPDLFFGTHPKNSAEVDKVVDTERGGFNKTVRDALKRHLMMYLVWKEKTYDEMKTRRTFTIKYLKQHYEIIKMYMAWVRPYLRHIRRLTLDEEKMATPDLISAFEGSMLEIEFIASKKPNTKKYNSCILASFLYRTRPNMAFQQEGYQRGPVHVGRLEINLRAYTWTDEQIEAFKKLRSDEDMELLKSISDSVKSAMEALGESLDKYLREAATGFEKEEKKEAKEEKKKELGFFDRFAMEFFGTKPGEKDVKKAASLSTIADAKDKGEAKKEVLDRMFWAFKNFKKAHGMIMW